MSLKVVGAGLGRTGTHSLKLALERLLGAPCYHMMEVMQHPDHIPMWHAAAKGEPVDWAKLMSGYEAAVDWPACAFWQDLSRAFPDAIIVLSVRDSAAWWESAKDTIIPRIKGDYTADSEERKAWQAMVHATLESHFTLDLHNREACIAEFEKHNAEVLRTAPANRLVVWQATDGWEPLCKALGVPVPDEPFPKSNTKEEFIARVSASQ